MTRRDVAALRLMLCEIRSCSDFPADDTWCRLTPWLPPSVFAALSGARAELGWDDLSSRLLRARLALLLRTIQFDGRALAMVEAIKTASGRTTVADVVRDALALYYWSRRQVAEGHSICAVKDGKPMREVVLPFPQGTP